MKLLYAYLKTTRNINEYSQIKVNGRWIDHDIMNAILNDMTVFGYVHKIISLAHTYSMIIKKSREKNITTWAELFETVGCKDRKMQSRVKAALVSNKLIAELKTEFKGTTEKVFIINPFIYRKSAFVSQIALHAFRKDIDGYIDGYALTWLKAIGIV